MAPLLTVRVGECLTAIHCSKVAEQWISQGCHGDPHRVLRGQQPLSRSDSSTCATTSMSSSTRSGTSTSMSSSRLTRAVRARRGHNQQDHKPHVDRSASQHGQHRDDQAGCHGDPHRALRHDLEHDHGTTTSTSPSTTKPGDQSWQSDSSTNTTTSTTTSGRRGKLKPRHRGNTILVGGLTPSAGPGLPIHRQVTAQDIAHKLGSIPPH